MTRSHPDNSQPFDAHEDDGVKDAPLAPWMVDLARDVVHEMDASVDVPRDMMWARIQRERRSASPLHAEPIITQPASATVRPLAARTNGVGRWTRQIAAAAAVLITGVGIGRYVVPSAISSDTAAADSTIAPRGLGPDAIAAMPSNNDPAHVAMQEHLARTVSLLTTVRDDDPMLGPGADITPWARELLTTTRLLIDQPQLRDERTRRLLQDLELVLVQVIQARTAAPETQRAPKETLRETNLLTRVRAIVTASASTDGAIYGGD